MSASKNMLRVGLVSSVNKANCTVRVVFPDRDDSVSYELPVIVAHTLKTKHFSLPDVGENVICLFQGNGAQDGYCLGAIYSDVDLPPVQDKNLCGVWFEDGSHVYYDREKKKLHVKAVSDVYIDGNLHITGQIFTGESS
ncbi:phage baseplate assembly protein V [Brevibacillus centrosporus]|uniref:phage baseplate assembly protein V n=1 Tax=Brevibacillus centrosporus TaxID=54910 RepID=UPI000F0A1E6E|nr:phage baseplate assembly protein V [Brevibacillus centrosporus]MEC2131630.1 phage baseplate assembly protein V [Brevibacillus centrosporus]RNB63302.1 phage baseplate assembly protein V [Brevibacillus centrosporus]